MGIKNFPTYVEVFFGKSCFKEFTVNDVCYAIKDFSSHEITKTASPGDHDNANNRCGVYIDLSSYIYGRMSKSLENTEIYEKTISSIENTSDNVKTVTCELDSCTIEKVACDCTETILNALAPMLLKAYRVYLAYDTVQPKAKLFEQNRRKKRSHFQISAASRTACYANIATKVKNYILESHKNTLQRFADTTSAMCNNSEVEATIESKLFPLNSSEFTKGEGEWKCFYQIYRDISDDAVDVCYVFGHDWDIGLAMTMYQHPKSPSAIKYVYGPNSLFEHNKHFDRTERMLHFICLTLSGNDYTGGLVNLSQRNALLMKKEMDKICSGEAGPCTSSEVEDLSCIVFNNDESTDVPMIKFEYTQEISRAFATVVMRLLAAVYGNDRTLYPNMVEHVLYYANVGPFCSSAESDEDLFKLREYLKKRRIDPRESAISDSSEFSNEGTLLTCRDAQANKVMRTLQQCMDMFALSALWYLSYTTFFFRSPSGRRMMETAKPNESFLMNIGITMFSFGGESLSERFDLCHLLELKKILQKINGCLLFWIIEGAFHNVLCSE